MNSKRLIVRIGTQDVFALIIASLPILGLYGFFGLDIGLGVVLLSLAGAISIVLYIKNSKKLISILPILITYMYFIIRKKGYFNEQLLLIMALINIIGFCGGSLNSSKYRKIIIYIATINVILVIIQVILHYVLGYNLSLINEDLLKEGVNAGTLGGSLFRPSGLFLEPAHFSEYCIIALLSILFPEDGIHTNLKKAFFISAGCLLTTSGIGIFSVAAIWGWYVLFKKRKSGTKIVYLILWSLFALIIIALLLQIPFFKLAVQRVFGEVDGYNAINGRFWAWDSVIGKMKGNILTWGYGSSDFFKGYMTGLMQIIVQYGIVGVFLFILPFVYYSVCARTNYVILGSVVYCSLMIIANLSSVYSMVFYTAVVIAETKRIVNDRNHANIIPKKLVSRI